ncbi:helix-turn-helix domain-containing protein [Acinetobacter radioresistens]|nr:helix-turn-helix domain-containing protein [Acinetobacter radioresistens]
MQQYFPGNVRELRNIIERAITLSDNEYIDLPQLQSAPLRNVQNFVAGQINHEPLTDQVIPLSPHRKIPAEGLEQYLENIEKEVLLTALNQTHWNRTLAAKKLGMSFRSLRYRLKKFGLDTDDE